MSPDLKELREAKLDGCLFRRAGVVCRLPGSVGGIPSACAHCGWFPAGEKRRKLKRQNGGETET